MQHSRIDAELVPEADAISIACGYILRNNIAGIDLHISDHECNIYN